MTTCPECGADFETVAQVKDLPIQALAQECTGCDYSVDVSIINYPSGTFSVVSPALKGDICGERISPDGLRLTGCGNDAMIRIQKVGQPVEGRCADHMRAHHETALGLRDEL